ncbi:MAG TPA: undecaprenyl-diphosphate phosphatase [Planctomycetota bacterium]|nr:undecaprenyl-diphosphate phosphatase [Planctomycetota bacterium]
MIGGPSLGLFDAVVLGLVEGITEFLPISSTGHLIVAQRLLGLGEGGANNVFAIGIQMGAITAILVLYWRRLVEALRTVLRPTAAAPNLLWQIAIAALPAVLLGLCCDDWIDAHLFSPGVVAATMVIGGALLLALERFVAGRPAGVSELAAMPYRAALGIGLFQCLALVPGTSRSAATIAGALLLGLSRTAAAEFSFLVGLPILYGASLYKLVKHRDLLTGEVVAPFVVGTAVAFVSALAVVVPFVRYLRRHTFLPFAWYRIAAGLVLAWLCWQQYVR